MMGAMPTATSATAPASRMRPLYLSLWAGMPRELLYLLLALPVALSGFVTTVILTSVGAGTIVTLFLGVFLFIGAFYVSRGFGTLDLIRLRWAGRPDIPRPEWQDYAARSGFWAWLKALFGNGHYWLALLHTLVISPVLSLISWTVTVIWISLGLVGVTWWFWQLLGLQQGTLTGLVLDGLDVTPLVDPAVIDGLMFTALGVVALATLPLVTTGLVRMHWFVAIGVLGAFRSDALRRQVVELGASRGAAVAAEGHSLERLERDIHDGPQQRLVRLQMDLAAAERQWDRDPDAARELIAQALHQAREALDELRSLSRGFAPPMLSDRGLVAALESAATRSPIPTTVRSELADGAVLPSEVERGGYFVASEALANAAKHSGASAIVVDVRLRRVADGDTTWLDVIVTDDGRGEASAVPGHGLAGLEERLRGLGGILEVESPVGGPTTVSGHLPITYGDEGRAL
ncbi:MAG: hypothetical protein RI885_170 [Actinomycetota bacterium]